MTASRCIAFVITLTISLSSVVLPILQSPAEASLLNCVPASTSLIGGREVLVFSVGECLWQPPIGISSVKALVVGGGGGGGSADGAQPDGAGGGGGGGWVTSGQVHLSGQPIKISVGVGGDGAMSPDTSGTDGQSSSVIDGMTVLRSAGGTGGIGARTNGGPQQLSGNGGSSGNTVSRVNQSTTGGWSSWDGAGGGAGAKSNGVNGSDIGGFGGSGGNGGAGIVDPLDGSSREFGCGGGGGGSANVGGGQIVNQSGMVLGDAPWSSVTGSGGSGGCSSGGNATQLNRTGTAATPGLDGTGGGGGGGGITVCEDPASGKAASCSSQVLSAQELGARGGAGTVIISYSAARPAPLSARSLRHLGLGTARPLTGNIT